MNLIVSVERTRREHVEVVERKGRGHPDTICDSLAEALSRALCQRYLATFGEVQHHNVDKALLCAGQSLPAFGGGRVTAPIDIYLAGRAVSPRDDGPDVLRELATASARDWLKDHIHALDPTRHVRIHPVLRPGSSELRSLYQGRSGVAPRANDTSFGVGYAPASSLERLVLALDDKLYQASKHQHPAWGEDIKIMGVRHGEDIELTIACAMVDAHVGSLGDYLEQKAAIEALALELAQGRGFASCRVSVNAGDQPDQGALYLTVTGTSAEAGDDGQVGRGNRVNGLITPWRPMSLEAAAGKNPVTHVGKIYNVAASEIASEIVRTIAPVTSARCLLVGQIGSPITEPHLVNIVAETEDGAIVQDARAEVAAIAEAALARLPARVDEFVRGGVILF